MEELEEAKSTAFTSGRSSQDLSRRKSHEHYLELPRIRSKTWKANVLLKRDAPFHLFILKLQQKKNMLSVSWQYHRLATTTLFTL